MLRLTKMTITTNKNDNDSNQKSFQILLNTNNNSSNKIPKYRLLTNNLIDYFDRIRSNRICIFLFIILFVYQFCQFYSIKNEFELFKLKTNKALFMFEQSNDNSIFENQPLVSLSKVEGI